MNATDGIRLQMNNQARIKCMADTELEREIERTERQARVLDAAEGRQWFSEMAERDANYMWLMALRDERTDRERCVAA
jgi:hypothetical protein